MKKFYQKVDKRNKEEMKNYIENHERYSTMNSWNGESSYANNVKVHNLELTREQENLSYELVYDVCCYDYLFNIIDEWAEKQNYHFTAGFNGRSGGYLVLYRAERKKLDWKSSCRNCGQKNYKTIEEKGDNICGRCHKRKLVNLERPIYKLETKNHGIYDDVDEMDIEELKERVELLQSFDQLCDELLEAFIVEIEYHKEWKKEQYKEELEEKEEKLVEMKDELEDMIHHEEDEDDILDLKDDIDILINDIEELRKKIQAD